MQNQNQHGVTEGNNIAATNIGQQQIMHPLLMPSLVCDATCSKIVFFRESNRSLRIFQHDFLY
jgi:hypothetical protein